MSNNTSNNGQTGHVVIGIDPGANTGLAAYLPCEGRYLTVATMPIHRAMAAVQSWHDMGRLELVVFEDARLRKWYGKADRERLQGAGSIKRDCTIWSEFLADLAGVRVLAVPPQAGATKWSAERFAKVTGWTSRTSEHARDAAMLLWGR